MSTDKGAVLREILNREMSDPAYGAAADILRAMVILYGSAWESDLIDVLTGLWSVKNYSLEKISEMRDMVDEAEKILTKGGLIMVEKRPRPFLEESKPSEEKFYTTHDIILIMRFLSSDRYIDRYRYEVSGWVGPPK